jgi:1-phosphofructokinase
MEAEPGTVMVFVPAPQLTVTIEQQADVAELHVHPGGQGVWQARMCAALGAEVTVCAAAGGEIGALIAATLRQEDLRVRLVERATGSGWYVHDRREGGRTTIAEHPGDALQRHDLDELYTAALAEGLRARVSILSGPPGRNVVDPEVYRRLAADLSTNGGRVVADLSGDYLTAVLDGKVAFLKVSHEELIDDGLAGDDSPESLIGAGRALCAKGAETVLISRADQPALALVGDEVLQVGLPSLQVVEHRGAGDSMTAGAAAVLARDGDVREALRTGAAAGALNVTRHGLGTGRRDAIAELAERVEITELPRAG